MLGALALAAVALPANASLIGTTVNITSPHGNCLGVTVDGSVECRIQENPFVVDEVIDVDVEDSRIVFEFLDVTNGGVSYVWTPTPRTFDVVVSGLTWVDDPSAAIASIAVTTELFGTAGTSVPNTIGAVQSGANQVTLNFGDLDRRTCETELCARLTVDITPEQKDLPEPGTLALFGFGLLGLAAAQRSRRPA